MKNEQWPHNPEEKEERIPSVVINEDGLVFNTRFPEEPDSYFPPPWRDSETELGANVGSIKDQLRHLYQEHGSSVVDMDEWKKTVESLAQQQNALYLIHTADDFISDLLAGK